MSFLYFTKMHPMGFEPMHVSIADLKPAALTTRPKVRTSRAALRPAAPIHSKGVCL